MSESTDQQAQKPDDTPEYLKFVGLLVVMLVVILGLAFLSPRLISQVTPAVLGLDGSSEAQPAQAVEEEPAAPSSPETVVQPEGAAAPDGSVPETGLGGMEAEVQGIQHEVQPGQTLFQIAELYGVPVEEIAAANNVVNPYQLEAGRVLIIPQSP